MAEQLPPDWAIERAASMTRNESGTEDYDEAGYSVSTIKDSPSGFPTTLAFARYIAAHEDEPEDPLLDEVQNLADELRINLSAMPWAEKALLAALRRGIEIGKTSA